MYVVSQDSCLQSMEDQEKYIFVDMWSRYSASTLENLRSTLEPGEALVYFYCDFRNERSTNAAEVMRAILSQLFRHLRTFRVDPGALPNWILEQKSEYGALLLNDLDRLASWVCRAASRFSHKPIIVIDALDECANVQVLLGTLTMLVQADVRLLVTSRPEAIIEQHLGRYPSLSFQEMDKELAGDIYMHITRELDSYAELRFADTCVKNEIRTKLREKAEGRFRWIQCQLDTLKRCSSRKELQQVLADLPGELGTTYERILCKIDERRPEGKVARSALAWLVVALEPLRLVQLIEGLALDAHKRGIDCETSMGPALVHALSSLVIYYKATDVLALSHHTVKVYMSFILRFRATQALFESFPILSYVFGVGFDHLAYVDPESTVILDDFQSFASNIQHHPSHWDLLCELRGEDARRLYPPWPSSRHDLVPYILIVYSSTSLFRPFLQSHPFKPRVGTNPLVYATDFYKTAHASTLLKSGAGVNEPGLVVDDSRHALPLEVAIDLGNDMLVGELLQKGSVVPPELITTAVCMPWCTAPVLVHLVHTDAFKEWARGMKDKELYRSVFSSARPNAGDTTQADRDHVALARRPRAVGQNLSANSAFGAELIERALHAGHASMLEHLLPRDQPPPDQFLVIACTGNTSETIPVVRVLLKRGANIHAVSPGYDAALHLASMCPWEPRALELTKILMDAGCNPTARNGRGETPMTIAMKQGHATVVGHFLPSSISTPSHILLHAIKRRMNPQMVQVLIRRGASSIDARTSSGKTALHLILMNRYSADGLNLKVNHGRT
ncbi:ankyrin repeat-containing domain protein [Chiua virens]|nr:ankyrin repeat-containing domain protein [Chiua virens]